MPQFSWKKKRKSEAAKKEEWWQKKKRYATGTRMAKQQSHACSKEKADILLFKHTASFQIGKKIQKRDKILVPKTSSHCVKIDSTDPLHKQMRE